MGGRVLREVPLDKAAEGDMYDTLPRSLQSEGTHAGCIVATLVMLEGFRMSFIMAMQLEAQLKYTSIV